MIPLALLMPRAQSDSPRNWPNEGGNALPKLGTFGNKSSEIMKTRPLLLVLTVIPLFAAPAETTLPADVQKLVDQRAAALIRIGKPYEEGLEKLKIEYTKQGDLETANLIVSLLKGRTLPEKINKAAVQSLVDQHDAALAKVNRIYVGELEKAKVAYTKKSDLETANAIVALIKQTPVKESDAKPVPVFLDDLRESDVKVGYGNLGKHGMGPDGGIKVVTGGAIPAHSLVAHPPSDGSSLVSYHLGKEYSKLEGTATLPDGRFLPTALVFRVLGDGKTLWQSRPIKGPGGAEKFSVSVTDIRKITMEVNCPGSNMFAWALWLEPRLLK